MPRKKTTLTLTRSIGIRATPDLRKRLGRYLNDTEQTKQEFLTVLIETALKKAGYGPEKKSGA